MGIGNWLFGDLWGLNRKRKEQVWIDLGNRREEYSDEKLQSALWDYVSSETNDKDKKAKVARLFNDRKD